MGPVRGQVGGGGGGGGAGVGLRAGFFSACVGFDVGAGVFAAFLLLQLRLQACEQVEVYVRDV